MVQDDFKQDFWDNNEAVEEMSQVFKAKSRTVGLVCFFYSVKDFIKNLGNNQKMLPVAFLAPKTSTQSQDKTPQPDGAKRVEEYTNIVNRIPKNFVSLIESSYDPNGALVKNSFSVDSVNPNPNYNRNFIKKPEVKGYGIVNEQSGTAGLNNDFNNEYDGFPDL